MGERGLEPPRIAALVPETSVYTNFTTAADLVIQISAKLLGLVNWNPTTGVIVEYIPESYKYQGSILYPQCDMFML